jgi:hypothetical protein
LSSSDADVSLRWLLLLHGETLLSLSSLTCR